MEALKKQQDLLKVQQDEPKPALNQTSTPPPRPRTRPNTGKPKEPPAPIFATDFDPESSKPANTDAFGNADPFSGAAPAVDPFSGTSTTNTAPSNDPFLSGGADVFGSSVESSSSGFAADFSAFEDFSFTPAPVEGEKPKRPPPRPAGPPRPAPPSVKTEDVA